MTWAPQQVQITIFTLLKADTALATLLDTTVAGAQKIFDFVPDNTAFPFVVIESKPYEDRGSYTTEGLQAEISIHTWYQPGGSSSVAGRGDKQVQLIQDRIDKLLHKQSVTISGWNALILRRSFIDIVVDPDNVTRHGIQKFKLFLGGQ